MPETTIDQLLQTLDRGDRAAFDQLVAAVYPDLLTIARALLRSQPADHPYDCADLVHEAYLRLVRYQDVRWRGRTHFFGAVTQTMRRLLIDHARAASARKRKGEHVSLEADTIAQDATPLDRTDWEDLLACLAREHPRWAQIVESRCVRGRTIQETADDLGVSHCTISKDWRRARQWMRRELGLPRDRNRNPKRTSGVGRPRRVASAAENGASPRV